MKQGRVQLTFRWPNGISSRQNLAVFEETDIKWGVVLTIREQPYPVKFRRQLVELVQLGRTPEDLSCEFRPSAQVIWNWVMQAERDKARPGRGGGAKQADELARLHREVLELRKARDSMATAAARIARAMKQVDADGSGS